MLLYFYSINFSWLPVRFHITYEVHLPCYLLWVMWNNLAVRDQSTSIAHQGAWGTLIHPCTWRQPLGIWAISVVDTSSPKLAAKIYSQHHSYKVVFIENGVVLKQSALSAKHKQNTLTLSLLHHAHVQTATTFTHPRAVNTHDHEGCRGPRYHAGGDVGVIEDETVHVEGDDLWHSQHHGEQPDHHNLHCRHSGNTSLLHPWPGRHCAIPEVKGDVNISMFLFVCEMATHPSFHFQYQLPLALLVIKMCEKIVIYLTINTFSNSLFSCV